MNFIQLQDHRINLDNVVEYFPSERSIDILNKPQMWYSIVFDTTSGREHLCYKENLAARDLDLMTLDFVCVQNKRGNVKELKKVQQS